MKTRKIVITIVSSGQKREYLLYVPRSYDRAKPTPLVISMHAAGRGGGTAVLPFRAGRVPRCSVGDLPS